MLYICKIQKGAKGMTVEQIIKEIEQMNILDFVQFLDSFEKSSIIGNLLVEDWRKEDGENKQRVF